MIKRLAITGAILVIIGPLNLSGHGTIATAAGGALLLASTVTWAVTRRRTSQSDRQ